ncbi:uncharacterized protein LOC128192768 [Crassostrea angulata]|uniref:uncharacterized protein LOC128192768 n=1 Tax=Magallana angulata TaxID=2784310 RepID=UPI0022B171C5|nr:uncharacterized protein LOC128192768 [Crassostrea angulata]
MPTGHVLPGYGQPVTYLRRAKSAYPLDKSKIKEYAAQNVPAPERNELLRIKSQARDQWLGLDRAATTYDFQFKYRNLDQPTQSRPTSPTRKNKPHPPLVFLTNRLHYVPGYHNADTTINRPVYQVDASVPYEEQAQRWALRDKYIGKPSAKAINQYTDKYGYREYFDPVEAQAAEAWTKLADDKDLYQLPNVFDEQKGKHITEPNVEHGIPLQEPQRPKTAMASTYRWMKYAGASENMELHRALEAIRNRGQMPNMMRYSRNGIGSTEMRRRDDIEAVQRTRYVAKPSRGDFLMHPDWPSSIPHHRVD